MRSLPRGACLKYLQQSPPLVISKWKPHIAPATHLERLVGAALSAFTLDDMKPMHQKFCDAEMLLTNHACKANLKYQVKYFLEKCTVK